MSPTATTLLAELGRATLWLSLAGALTALALKWARVQSPLVHRIGWCAVLLIGCFLVPVPIDVPWYASEPAAAAAAIAEPEPRGMISPAEELALLPGADREPLSFDMEEPLAAAPMALPLMAEITESQPAPPVVPAPSGWELAWPQLAIGLWAAGIVALAVAWLAGYVWFMWRLPAGIEAPAEWQAQWNALFAGQGGGRPIPLRVTRGLGPLLCRLPRGYELLVPAPLWRRLNAAEREAILRHELAHYRRGDVWKSLGVRALALVHWFNPVSWWAVRRFDEAAEWACDQAATDGEPAAYAKMLMHLGELSARPARYGSALRGRRLAARIRRLVLSEPKEDSAMKKALLVTAVVCLVSTALVRVQLVAREPSKPSDGEPSVSNETEPLLAEGDSGPDEPPPAVETSEPVRSTTKAKADRSVVDAAKEAYEAAVRAFQAETTVMESVYLWSSRWLAAELTVARDRQGQLDAAQAHAERMRKLQKSIKELHDIGAFGGEPFRMASVNFYVAEAEGKLAAIRSRNAQRRNEGARLEDSARGLAASRPHSARPRDAAQPVPIPNAVPAPVRPRPTRPVLVPSPAGPQADSSFTPPAAPLAPAEATVPPAIAPPSGVLAPATPGQAQPPPDLPPAKPALPALEPTLPPAKPALPALEPTQPLPAPVEPEAASLPRAEPSLATPQAGNQSGAVAKRELRYDGKTFDEWVYLLRTDLSPKVRAKAVNALAEFAVNGFGQPATKVILDVMRAYHPAPFGSSERGVRDAALAMIFKTPREQTLPRILAALDSDNENQRRFAIDALPINMAAEQIIPALAALIADEDPYVAQRARNKLQAMSPDHQALTAWLRERLTSKDPQQILEALSEVGPSQLGGPGIQPDWRTANLKILPDVIALLGHDDLATRRRAAQALRDIGKPALPALEREASRSATETRSKRARQLSEQIQTWKPESPRLPFTWERE